MTAKKPTINSLISKAIDAITVIVCVLVAAFSIYSFICRTSGKEVTLFGKSLLRIITDSMNPTICSGDYIIIEKTDADSLQVGDIISFYSEQSDIYGRLNTHRIVEINPDGTFTTKGDAASENDSVEVKRENVVGRLVFIIHLPEFISEKAIIVFLVGIVVVVMINESVVIIKTLAEKKEGDDE